MWRVIKVPGRDCRDQTAPQPYSQDFFFTLKRVSKMSYCSLKTGLDASDVLVSDPGFLRRCRTLSLSLVSARDYKRANAAAVVNRRR
jgi:hypothetical protein